MGKRYPKQVCFKYDVTMKFEETPIWQFVPSLNFSDTESELINAEIPKVIHKNIFLHTVRKPNDYISGIFIRTKRDGNYRMIINLERFNEFFKFEPSKLESAEAALNLFTEGCYFGSVDLKDACYSIPINVNYQRYLKLSWENE